MNDQDDHDNDQGDLGNQYVDHDDIDYDGIVDIGVDNDVDDEDDSKHVRESRCLPCGTPCLQKLKLNPTCPMSIHWPTAAESSHFISLHCVAKIEIESNFIVFTFH